MVVVEAHVVRVAFDSGDILALSPRSALGVIDPPTPRAPRTRRAAYTMALRRSRASVSNSASIRAKDRSYSGRLHLGEIASRLVKNVAIAARAEASS